MKTTIRAFFFIQIILFSFLSSAQVKKKLSYNVFLTENMEKSKPSESVLFYFDGEKELSKYYEKLSSKISNKISNKIISSYTIDLDTPKKINSFDENNIKYNNVKYKYICYFYFGGIDNDAITVLKYGDPHMITYSLYSVVVQSDSKKVISKKKYQVTTEKNILTSVGRLSKAILKELNLLKNQRK